jgi:predicted adenine nucleotide alpha hydrolase (AANH) superfamily ATPase
MNDDERREGSKRIFMQHRRVNYESKNFHKNGAFVRSSEMRVEYNKEYAGRAFTSLRTLQSSINLQSAS